MLYVARFSFDQHEKGKDEVGSFGVLVEAKNPDDAVEACRVYLETVVRKHKRDVFEGKVVMYLDDLIEVKSPISRPALISYRCQVADSVSEIMNAMLDGPSQVTAYGWGDPDKPDSEPFMTFEPSPVRARVQTKKRKALPRNNAK